MGFIQRWWDGRRGSQLLITTTVSGSVGVLLLASAFQLLFMQEMEGWSQYTAAATFIALFSVIALFIVLPEHLRLKSLVATLEYTMSLESISHYKKHRPDAQLAAEQLGGGWLARWEAFEQDRS